MKKLIIVAFTISLFAPQIVQAQGTLYMSNLGQPSTASYAAGSNYSSGKLVISASAGGYGNTNYYFDDGRTNTYADTNYAVGLNAANGVIQNGAPTNSVIYSNSNTNSLIGHITNGSNVAGYLCWGAHSALNGTYATNNSVIWSGNSSWYLIRTVESFNGRWYDQYDGNFMEWYSANAFGGSNYSNTPIGAVSYTDEPFVDGTTDSIYFGLWEGGKNFAICSWNAFNVIVNHTFYQVVGDPLISK